MIVSAQGLIVRYGATTAVAGIDLTAIPGTVLAVVGPNGSGKSSLVKAIAGVVRAEGTILFDGSAARPSKIAYMAQDIGGRAALTVLEVVLLGRLNQLGLRVDKRDRDAVRDILEQLQISQLAGRHLGELSGGQRQIVFLAQALASEPRVLLLDEPISALDLRHQLEVLDLIRKHTLARRLTTVCVLHDLGASVRIADRVAMIREGRLVVEGPPRSVVTAHNVTKVFEVEAEIVATADGGMIVHAIRPHRG